MRQRGKYEKYSTKMLEMTGNREKGCGMRKKGKGGNEERKGLEGWYVKEMRDEMDVGCEAFNRLTIGFFTQMIFFYSPMLSTPRGIITSAYFLV